MPVCLRKNDLPNKYGQNSVVALTQSLLGVPVGRVPRCHAVVDRAVDPGERGDRNEEQLSLPRRIYRPMQ